MIKLAKILPEPALPARLPATAKWLSGEGAGSWFVIEEEENSSQYRITRFSPEGNIECEGVFSSEKKVILKKGFEITYPSHCLKVTIIHNKEKVSFNRHE
jgi:hypothetical protein